MAILLQICGALLHLQVRVELPDHDAVQLSVWPLIPPNDINILYQFYLCVKCVFTFLNSYHYCLLLVEDTLDIVYVPERWWKKMLNLVQFLFIAIAFFKLTFDLCLSTGYEVLVGRNNRQNDVLTNRVATDYDLWFHARNIPGSHVHFLSFTTVNWYFTYLLPTNKNDNNHNHFGNVLCNSIFKYWSTHFCYRILKAGLRMWRTEIKMVLSVSCFFGTDGIAGAAWTKCDRRGFAVFSWSSSILL